jgi:hypothetical protein
MNMILDKLIMSNKNINCAISTILCEYDIKSAHTTACYFIYGEEMYKKLMAMPKLERNIEIGKMMKVDPTLYPKIETLLLKWMNEFLDVNGVKQQNFIETTRDSILLVNKKPTTTTFEGGIVEFRNKDGEYTSFYRINGKSILFDNMSYNIRIKGINSDDSIIKNSYFVQKYLKPLLIVVENVHSTGIVKCMKQLATFRDKYINNDNLDIYRDLMQENKFVSIINDEIVLSDYVMDESKLVKLNNFKNFVMPVMRSILTVK